MIKQLNIKNFLTFKELTIDPLKRVNLIAGKNNAGKTALLEALRILTSKGDSSILCNILKNRGSYNGGKNNNFQALFHSLSTKKNIAINSLLIYQKNRSSFLVTLNNTPPQELYSGANPDHPFDTAVFVPYLSNYKTLNRLWNSIVLTPKEDDVIKIIRESVEPKLMRFDVGSDQVRVRLKGSEKPVPLKSLGDGVYRILLIALSLANAKGKCLLIDEIELGLHHSVIEKLWEMIFKYAKEWDIQVFATTHSQDAIKTFHYIASTEENINDAEYIRLQIGRNGENEAIVYDSNRLIDSLDLELEIR